MQAHTQRTHSDLWSHLATMPECSFKIGDLQSEKKQWNRDLRAICNQTRDIDAGRRVIRHQGISHGPDRARPLWHRHSAQTEIFFADANVLTFSKTFSASLFDFRVGRINPGMFGVALISHCSGPSGSSMPISRSILDSTSAAQSSSLSFGWSKSQFQVSQCSVSDSISNGSKFPSWFRVRFHQRPDCANRSYHRKNPDCWKWAGLTPKNLAFQLHHFGTNKVFEFWSYHDMISTYIVQF